MKVLLAAMLVFVAFAARAELTQAEKDLLNSAISADSAQQMGKAADAAGLARIIALSDPNLVSSFGRGLSLADPLPPPVEALVLEHFDDPGMGMALRWMTRGYQTRALFDRFYAIAQGAYETRDPVFEQILRTDQAGIDDAVLRIAPKFPSRAGTLSPALAFAGKRKYPGAVEPLLKAIETDYRGNAFYSAALTLLLHYEQPEVWRAASEEIERLQRERLVPESAYKNARGLLDAALKDPQAALVRQRKEEAMAALGARRSALQQLSTDASRLSSDPPRYIEAQARYLASLEPFATSLHDPWVDLSVAAEYRNLGLYALMRARDPKAALPYLEKAARGRDLLGVVALADTLQLGRNDKPAAIRAYQAALDMANDTTAPVQTFQGGVAFWREWFAAEILYLRTGKAFRGRVSEAAITGFWDDARFLRTSIWSFFPLAPIPGSVRAGSPGYGAFALNADSSFIRTQWPVVAEKYRILATPERARQLAELPPSRISLVGAMREVSALDDPAAILSEFARHDPSGYWTAIMLGTVAYHEARGRDGALDDGVADLMPGMAAPGQPNPLAIAARRFMQSRHLRVAQTK